MPRDPAALPPVLDLEWNHRSRICTHRPDPATVRAEAARFLDILTAHYGQRPVVYTTVDFYRDTGIGVLPQTEFWLRSVAGHPSTVYPGRRWTFWQYSRHRAHPRDPRAGGASERWRNERRFLWPVPAEKKPAR